MDVMHARLHRKHYIFTTDADGLLGKFLNLSDLPPNRQ